MPEYIDVRVGKAPPRVAAAQAKLAYYMNRFEASNRRDEIAFLRASRALEDLTWETAAARAVRTAAPA